MGGIKDFMTAAASTGNRVSGIVGYTNVDSNNGARQVVETIRWTYFEYASAFENCKSLEEAEYVCNGIVKSLEHVKRYKQRHAFVNHCDVATIQMALLWTYRYVVTGSKDRIMLCYVQNPTAESDLDFITEVHMGKFWNSFVVCGMDKDLSYVVADNLDGKGPRKMDILNKGMDTYEVFLTTQKEG